MDPTEAPTQQVETSVFHASDLELTRAPTSVLARRLSMAGCYAVLTVLLARTIAGEIGTVRGVLEGIGGVLPTALQALGPEPASVALLALGLIVFFLAAGTFLITRDTGSAFALLAVGTVGWFLFPYSEVPWAAVVTGGNQATLSPPTSAWILGGLIAAVATAEVLFSARDTLLRGFVRRGLDPEMIDRARATTRASAVRLMGLSLGLGTALAWGYGLFKDVLSRGILREPNLVWVPAVLGLVAGVAIWLSSRER